MIITLIIEIGLALLFKYRSKKAIGIIMLTNIFTQLLLDISIFERSDKSSGIAAAILLLSMEILILIIEIVIYEIFLTEAKQRITNEDGKIVDNSKKRFVKPFLYALSANAASFIIGGVVSTIFDIVSSIF